MTLGELIEFLEKEDPNQVVPMGFCNRPHSYRGYYADLAFEPTERATRAEMLEAAKSCLGKTFEGYKGGDFIMHKDVDVYISNYGESSGNLIGPMLLNYMFNKYS